MPGPIIVCPYFLKKKSSIWDSSFWSIKHEEIPMEKDKNLPAKVCGQWLLYEVQRILTEIYTKYPTGRWLIISPCYDRVRGKHSDIMQRSHCASVFWYAWEIGPSSQGNFHIYPVISENSCRFHAIMRQWQPIFKPAITTMILGWLARLED